MFGLVDTGGEENKLSSGWLTLREGGCWFWSACLRFARSPLLLPSRPSHHAAVSVLSGALPSCLTVHLACRAWARLRAYRVGAKHSKRSAPRPAPVFSPEFVQLSFLLRISEPGRPWAPLRLPVQRWCNTAWSLTLCSGRVYFRQGLDLHTHMSQWPRVTSDICVRVI